MPRRSADPLPYSKAGGGATAGCGTIARERDLHAPRRPVCERQVIGLGGRPAARLGRSRSRLRWPTRAVSRFAAKGPRAVVPRVIPSGPSGSRSEGYSLYPSSGRSHAFPSMSCEPYPLDRFKPARCVLPPLLPHHHAISSNSP